MGNQKTELEYISKYILTGSSDDYRIFPFDEFSEIMSSGITDEEVVGSYDLNPKIFICYKGKGLCIPLPEGIIEEIAFIKNTATCRKFTVQMYCQNIKIEDKENG